MKDTPDRAIFNMNSSLVLGSSPPRVIVLFLLMVILPLFGEDYGSRNLFDEKGPAVIYHGRRDRRQIALTIDDGWVPDYGLIDFLERERVSCTVFIPGKLMAYRPDWVKRLDRMGAEIAGHGYSHKWLPYLPFERQREELDATQALIGDITGKTCYLIRPSGGVLDGPYPSLELMRDRGYTVILWENDVGGYGTSDTLESQLDWLWNHLRPGNIILSHFGDSLRTREVLEIWVPQVRALGYEFVTVGRMLEEMEDNGI